MMHSTINKKLILLVFSFFLLVNIASSGGHFDVWDGTETFLVTESMVLKHTAKLDPTIPSVKKIHFDIFWSESSNAFRQGSKYYLALYNRDIHDIDKLPAFYTFRSLLLSTIAVPFYYLAIIVSVSPIALVGLFVNSLLISLTSLVIFCFSLEVYGSKKIAFVLSLIYGVCSFVWPHITSLWPQPLQALILITSAFFIFKSIHEHQQIFFICYYTRQNLNKNKAIYFAGLGGLFLGLSVFAHPTGVLLIPAFIGYCIFSMIHNRKSLCSFLIVLGVILSFVGLVNYWRFGSVTEFGYGYEGRLSTHTGWTGLIGLLASPGSGLIFFFPVAILFPLAMIYMYRKNRGLFFLSAYIVVVNLLYFGTIPGELFWSGGGWGPRYLIPILPFITIVSGILLQRIKKTFHFKYGRLFMKLSIIILSAAGFFVNLLGILVWVFYGVWYGFTNDFQYMRMGYYWDPFHSHLIIQIKTLVSGYVSHINPEQWVSMQFWSSLYQGLAPCPYDNYIFCKFGIIPILLLSALIGVVAVLIMMELSKFNPNVFFVIQLKSIKRGTYMIIHLLQK